MAASISLKIIDLQRVGERHPVPERRVVKDLAALNYSADAGLFSFSDRARFLKMYLEQAGFRWSFKKLAKKVLRKTGRIRRHDEKSKRKRPLPEIRDER